MNLLVLSTWFPYPPGNGSRIRAYFLLRELVRAGHSIRLVAGLQNDITPQDKEAGIAALRAMGIGEVVAVPWEWLGDTKRGLWSPVQAAFSRTPRAVLDTPNPALSHVVAAQIARPDTDAVLVLETGMDAYLPERLPPDLPLILDGVEIAEAVRLTDKNYFRRSTSPAGYAAQRQAHERARKTMRYWPRSFKRYAAVTTVSHQEAEAVLGICPGKLVAVVPNGVDTMGYAPRDPAQVKPGQLIYNGSVDYAPNRDGVCWFAENVLPRVREVVPEAELTVTGRYVPDATCVLLALENARPLTRIPSVAKKLLVLKETVHLTGFVTDLRPILAQASVCVVPLHYGGGTRLKILEAWAAGVPVVSTATGATGLEGAVPGTHYLQVADLPRSFAPLRSYKEYQKAQDEGAENFARATVRLLTDPDLARTLSENARALVVERYDWSRFGTQLSDLLLETCRASNPSL